MLTTFNIITHSRSYEASSKELQVAQATIEQNRAKSHDDRDKMAMGMYWL